MTRATPSSNTPGLCPITGRPLPEGFTIHPTLETRIRENAVALTELLPHLDAAITHQTHGNQSASARLPHTTGAPISFTTLERVDVIRDSLHAWTHALANHLHIPIPANPHPLVTRTLLTRNAYAACRWEDAPAFFDELDHITHLANWLFDPPARRVYYGPCPHCYQDITALPAHTPTTCPHCQSPFDALANRADMIHRLNTRILTRRHTLTALALNGYDIPGKTLDTWVTRGQLQPVTLNPARYRVTDALELAQTRVEGLTCVTGG